MTYHGDTYRVDGEGEAADESDDDGPLPIVIPDGGRVPSADDTDRAPTVYLPDGTPVKVRMIGAECMGDCSGEGHFGYSPTDLNGEEPTVYFEEVRSQGPGTDGDLVTDGGLVPEGFDLDEIKHAPSTTPDAERKRCPECGNLSISPRPSRGGAGSVKRVDHDWVCDLPDCRAAFDDSEVDDDA